MKLRCLLRNFRKDERGAVAVMFGISVMALFGIIGLAIDSSRVYNVHSKMMAALDAAALAAAKLLDDEDATQADFQATADSTVSQGRQVCILGVTRNAVSCSTGWCVGPSSPRPMES